MNDELTEAASAVASVRDAIGGLCDTHDEFAKTVGDTFDHLESLSLELFARHKRLELSVQHQAEHEAADAKNEHHLEECLEKLCHLEANVTAAQEASSQMQSEVSATLQRMQQEHVELCEAQEELRQISAEFRTLREGVEQDRIAANRTQQSILEHLQQLTDAWTESQAAQSPSGYEEQLASLIEMTRQQEATWQHDRAELEAELLAERQLADEQAKALAEQRRAVADQQAELAGELKRMRSLLEFLSNQMSQPLGDNNGSGMQISSSSENAALESMLAQFQMLQRDVAQRRATEHKDTAEHNPASGK